MRMVFRRRTRAVTTSVKNIAEFAGIVPATTNTVFLNMTESVDPVNVLLSDNNAVQRGCRISSFFVSIFIYTEGGEVANEVPLVDWYIIKDPGGNMSATRFSANGLPTPGTTGTHENKRYIFHTEKGLAGGGDASLNGVPMVFKGVLRIPRGFQTQRINDRIVFVIRTNFASKVCVQFIYKWYT